MRLFIIDDEVDLVRVLDLRLTQLGYQVLGAHCEAEALRLLPEFRPDFILLDLMLGDTNGIELIMKIRQRGCSCPIALMSGNLPKDIASRLTGLEPVRLLNKPFSIADLQAAINGPESGLTTGPAEVRR